jgi:hypothetical protein
MISPRPWKFALAAGLLSAGAIASSESLALALADIQPELAVKLNGKQSDALSNLASAKLGGAGSGSDNGKVEAQRAIAIDPLDVQAAAHLGLISQLANDQAAAAEIMNYAQRVSRRDTTTQFWWIEYWAQRGDVKRVLRHYDTALRTSSQAPSTLFPILVTAIQNPMVSHLLAGSLDNDALWTDQFVQQVAQSAQDGAAIVWFFEDLAAADFIVSERAISSAISRLIDVGTPAQGYALYSTFYPATRKLPIQNATFAENTHLPTAFDWNLTKASFYVGLGSDGLEIDAPATASGPVASQISQLPAGEWQVLLSHDGGLKGSEALSLDIACIGQSAASLPVAQRRPDILETRVRVAADCAHQRLTISLRSSEESKALKISRIKFREL